jgi:transcriptional regulator, AsnC family
MYLDGLDELDQKIIQLLIENARISYSDIGKETGISRVAVKARIQALEKKGIIEEYTTIINPQKISGAVSCYFEIEIKPDHLSQVTDILYKNDTSHRFTVSQEETGFIYMPLLHQVMKWNTSCTMSLIHCLALSAAVAI